MNTRIDTPLPPPILGGLPYEPRRVEPMGLLVEDAWRIKLYRMRQRNDPPAADLLHAAESCLRRFLPVGPQALPHYHIGFAILHQAREKNFLLLDWWCGENMLSHHVWATTCRDELHFTPFRTDNIVACVWELEVMMFERTEWIRHVLNRPHAPDFSRYVDAWLRVPTGAEVAT